MAACMLVMDANKILLIISRRGCFMAQLYAEIAALPSGGTYELLFEDLCLNYQLVKFSWESLHLNT